MHTRLLCRLCHVILHHAFELWSLIYSHTSCRVLSHVLQTLMMSCVHHATCMHWQAGHPYIIRMHQKILMHLPFAQAKQFLLKLTTSYSDSSNEDYANKNVMKIILIAVYNENKVNYNENFRTYPQESIGCLYKW